MMMNYIMDYDDERRREKYGYNEDALNKINYNSEEYHDEENNRCFEKMLCLKPVYGRALTTTHLGVKLLEWIPG